jgi:hypothetical protein
LVGQPFANHTLESLYGEGFVIHAQGNAVVIAEIVLAETAAQILLIAMLINTLHAALEDAKKASNASLETGIASVITSDEKC